MRAVIVIGLATIGTLAGTCAVACRSAGPAEATADPRRASATDWAGLRKPRPAGNPAALAPVTKNTWVLHIGDSFVDASLEQNLGPRFRAMGANYVVESATATYTTTWASDPALDRWLARRPSLVLVTLGANEVAMPSPAEHAAPIERLVRKIAAAGAACVWTSPPMWRKDTGILQVIHDHSAPCLFFDSDAVLGGLSAEERQRDGIHPNEKGGARWSEALWRWLLDHRDPTRPGFKLQPFELRGA